MNRTLEDWMTADVESVGPEQTVGDALDKMRSYRHLPVRSGDTFHGFLHKAALRGLPREQPLAKVTLEDPWTIPLATSLPSVLLRLRTTMDDVLWVTDDQEQLVGVFTEHDACRLAAQELAGKPLTVEAFATPAPETVHADEPLSRALSVMVRMWVRHLPVVNDDGLTGVLSWRDIIGRDPQARVSEFVSPAITVVNWTTPLGVAAQRLVEHGTGSAAVVGDEGELEGILTRVDVIRALVEPHHHAYV